MESLCNNILNNYLETQNVLLEEQYGFRKNRSTSLSIFNYVKFITESMNNNKVVGSIYIDFARAFDSVNHGRLIEKLTDMGIPWKLLFWIEELCLCSTRITLWSPTGFHIRANFI